MARRGAYKSEKRKKEVNRQKKQEKKRLKRMEKGSDSEGTVEVPEETADVAEGPEEGREADAE